MEFKLYFAIPYFMLLASVAHSEDENLQVYIHPSKHITRHVGKSLSLDCYVHPPVKSEIFWKTPENVTKTLSGDPYHKHLFIQKLKPSDFGVYHCQVKSRSSNEEVIHLTQTVHVSKVDCPSKFFQCSSGHCIPKRYICDGREDCPDGSEERHPFCNEKESCVDKIICTDGRCIPKSLCCYAEDPQCNTTYVLPCCQQYLDDLLHKNILNRKENAADENDAPKAAGKSSKVLIYFVVIAVIASLLMCLIIMKMCSNKANNQHELEFPRISRTFYFSRLLHQQLQFNDNVYNCHCIEPKLDQLPSNLTKCPSYSEACLDKPPPFESVVN